MSDEIALADIIRMLRDDILRLYEERKESGLPPLWKISDCEIELNIVSRESKNVDGKATAAIFATSASKSYSSEQVQKIKLKLTPIIHAGESNEAGEVLDVPSFLRRQEN